MPVSHLGLVVSHIPSATSFYLSALRPLGYRFVGQDGATIGLGVGQQADLFLTQEPSGRRPAIPTHIALDADSRTIVRECYTAALDAGGYPSGAPGYCNAEGTVFNAAVEDLDGNTLEFVCKDPAFFNPLEQPAKDQLVSWHEGTSHDAQPERSSQSRAALDLASTPPRSMRRREVSPSPGITRSRTEPSPPRSQLPRKAVFGTVLGAAAGAAFAWAMTKSERVNAREEADYNQSYRRRTSRRHSDAGEFSRREQDYDLPRSQHRNYSVTDIQPDYPARLRRSSRHIEPSRDEEPDYRDYMSRYVVRRRARPLENVQPEPAISDPGRSSRHHSQRSSTDHSNRKHYYIEAPPAASSRHSSARPKSHSRAATGSEAGHRRDSGVSITSHRSRHSHRSHRSRHGSDPPKSYSDVSTVKPTKSAGPSAAEVPLPASRHTSVAGSRRSQRPEDDDESDGLGDYKTVVPDDSISCVDFSKRDQGRRRVLRSHEPNVEDRWRHRSPDANRRSAVTIPVRSSRPREEMAYYLVRDKEPPKRRGTQI